MLKGALGEVCIYARGRAGLPPCRVAGEDRVMGFIKRKKLGNAF